MDAHSDLLKRFNKVYARFEKGSVYMDGPASLEDKEKWQPEFLKLINELNDLSNQLSKEAITDET